MINVLVNGAAGRMGREVLKTIWNADDTELMAAVDPQAAGEDAGVLMGIGSIGMEVKSDLTSALESARPDVMVDFTTPGTVYGNTMIALERRVRPVVGTTGFNPEEIQRIKDTSTKFRTGCIVAPNFAIGALLMMRFAAEACKYFPNVEIIELHHDQKLDAPSGTAVKTAELITGMRGEFKQGSPLEVEKIPGARGGEFEGGIRIHSVRLPGFVAHQEVLFGGLGQTLSIRHDSISRESFMPGVLLAVRRVMGLEEAVYGLENIIFER
ncbi:4-hydroxy-tetrahydrodipicolinate reductase [Desulfocucumis palustris]|uniref:4-hydroxy-tetrahydrodipicolinate reductase n=1 Tax=Desulfocucumis palustris TaxID=1898651 RepID=A0A2L2XD94_9FIRM|nr:4-hydroxy-tetrahydrodipicolinate reductase [Desulfocucumis palustris]GBF34195.1 4-hydroxy-tetrahydrodipicolinate reductase [Desulfocucumis palustris]